MRCEALLLSALLSGYAAAIADPENPDLTAQRMLRSRGDRQAPTLRASTMRPTMSTFLLHLPRQCVHCGEEVPRRRRRFCGNCALEFEVRYAHFRDKWADVGPRLTRLTDQVLAPGDVVPPGTWMAVRSCGFAGRLAAGASRKNSKP